MKDFYLYEDCQVLINKLGIKDQNELDCAEADYVSFRLKELASNPMAGSYDYEHLLKMHEFIFGDLYDWAGHQRRLNIYKEEPVLGGLSVEYSDVTDIAKDSIKILDDMRSKNWSEMDPIEISKEFSKSMASLWKIHPFREGNTRTVVTFCCQFADEKIHTVDRKLFEENSAYLRTAMVAYNAVFSDIGDRSRKDYLEKIVLDAFS